MWVIWFVLFGITGWWIKDPLTQLAALLLLALLPMYHYGYDTVLAVPTLALFLKRCSLVWPTLMTVSLSASWEGKLGRLMPAGPWRTIADRAGETYLPFLILLFLGGLLWLETRQKPVPENGQPQLNSAAPNGSPNTDPP
jgi:hypothetical protein